MTTPDLITERDRQMAALAEQSLASALAQNKWPGTARIGEGVLNWMQVHLGGKNEVVANLLQEADECDLNPEEHRAIDAARLHLDYFGDQGRM